MSQPTLHIPSRSGMPDPGSIISEKVFTPGGINTLALAAATSATRSYRILRTSEMDPYDSPLQPAEIAMIGAERAAAASDDFRGTARKAAKLSIANAAVEVFQDLRDLIETLPTDQTMITRQPRISTSSGSTRVLEEKRNMRVRGFLYAASREDDNDYHLILGRDPNLMPSTYMNIELSGLPMPGSKHFARLKATRDAYKTFFANDLPGTSYDFYDPPIPVQIEGSLFFDMNHSSGGRPGPASLRPNIPTIWEIHPISSIVFEPQGALAIIPAEAQEISAFDVSAGAAEFATGSARAGLPAEASILAEKTFTSPGKKSYRIIKTTEMDPYDPAASSKAVAKK